MEHRSLAKDLFEDMGRKVAEASAQEGDDDVKVVDSIESLCMNCHENVRPYQYSYLFILLCVGHHPSSSDQNPTLPRDCNHVLRLPPLPLQELRSTIGGRNTTAGSEVYV